MAQTQDVFESTVDSHRAFNVSMYAKCPNADLSANVRFNDQKVELPTPFSWDGMLAKTVELGFINSLEVSNLSGSSEASYEFLDFCVE